MPLLSDEIKNEVTKALDILQKPVTVELYILKTGCEHCQATHDLLTEVAALSSKIVLEVHELDAENELTASLQIDKFPAIIIKSEKEHGIRFFGIPAGYEFTAFISSLMLVSLGELQLTSATTAFLDALKEPVHLEVLTSPSCPYCPQMVMVVHQMAYYSEHITADMIEISEFPDIAEKYKVEGVPKTAINGVQFVDGAVSQEMIIDKIKAALNV